MSRERIELLSAVFGLIGGIILAFSLDRVLTELHLAIEFLSTSIESIAGKGPIFVFEGLDERRKRAERISRYWVKGGLLCLVISAALAIWGIYVPGAVRAPAKHTSATADPFVGHTFKAGHAEGNAFNNFGGDVLVTVWFGVLGPGGHLWEKSVECLFPPGTPVNDNGEPMPPIGSFRVLAPNGDRYNCDTG